MIREIITQADISMKKLVPSRVFFFFHCFGTIDVYGPELKRKSGPVLISKRGQKWEVFNPFLTGPYSIILLCERTLRLQMRTNKADQAVKRIYKLFQSSNTSKGTGMGFFIKMLHHGASTCIKTSFISIGNHTVFLVQFGINLHE